MALKGKSVALDIILRAKDEASKSVKAVEDHFSGLGGTVGKLASGALKVGAGAVVGLGAAAAGAGAALAKMAMDAAPIEGIRASFEALNADAGATLQSLREGSLGMVTDAELMRNYNEAVQLVGQSFADDLPNAMEYLSKISASTGKDMGFLLDSLTTGVGRLSPMILDNLAIQVDLVSANEAYAVSLGKSASELTEAEQKSALMAQVLEKLQENTAALPDVTGNASTSMAQLKTSLENAKNGIGEAMLPALTALLGPLAELAQQYGPAVVEWAQQAGVWLGENIPIALERASEFWNRTLKPALTNLWEFTRDDVIPIVKTIAAWLGENVPIAMEAISNFWNETLKPAFQAIIDLWNEDLKPAAKTLATMFSATLKGAWDTLTGAFDWAKTHVLDPVRDAFDRIKNAVQGVIDFIGGLIDKLGNLNLPDWLTPGSPTPFEIGLRGISDALRSMPDLSATFTLQPVAAPALAAHGGAGGRYFGGGLVINQYFGRDSVRSDDDIERIAQRIEDVLALRGAREF